MKRVVVTLAVGAAALCAALPASSADNPKLRLATNVSFPDRGFVLTTPKPVLLESAEVHVRENGQPIEGVGVLPARGAASRTFATVLVLDASNSMAGAPIVKAVAAARAFAAQRAAGQGLGVVTFNDEPDVVLDPTTDPEKIEQALSSTPDLAEGTHLYDAAALAIERLDEAGVTVRSIVLLTDGADTGSETAVSAVIENARAAGVRVFAVGLRSSQFSPQRLETLSRATGGAYTEAKSAANLSAIYGSLSNLLASEYLVRYRSLALPSQRVAVEVDAGSVGIARTAYVSPALPQVPNPFHRSIMDRFFASPLSALLVAVFVALLAWYIVRRILRGRRLTVQQRVGEFVKVAETNTSGEQPAAQQTFVGQRFVDLDHALARTPWWDRFKEDMEIAEFPIQPVPYALATLATTLLGAVVLASLFLPVYGLFALAIPFVAHGLVRKRLKEKRERFAEQLPDNLLVMAASLRAGHSFVGALGAVVDEADEPSQSELRRAVSDEQLGVPIEKGLVSVAERMDSGELEQVALVAALQRETGGNTAAVLDTVVDTVRDRFELRRTVKSLTAQGRMSRWILTLLPVAVFLLVSVINRGYMKPLFTTTTGQVLIVIVIVLLAMGSYMIKRITEIEL